MCRISIKTGRVFVRPGNRVDTINYYNSSKYTDQTARLIHLIMGRDFSV